MNNSALTKATYPLIIGGKEFAASTLTDKDYGEMDLYIQSKVIEVARVSSIGLFPTDRSELLQAAVKAAASSGWGTQEGSRILATVEGTARLGWQMIRANSRISFEEFLKLCRGDSVAATTDSMEAIQIAFNKLNGEDEEEEVKEASSESPKSQ